MSLARMYVKAIILIFSGKNNAIISGPLSPRVLPCIAGSDGTVVMPLLLCYGGYQSLYRIKSHK